MKFTLSWLKQFLVTEATLEEIANTLTDIGLEVEEVTDRSGELKEFEIAHIIKTEDHPSADKLKVCNVETKDGVLQIVCGAPNARSGIKVVLAKVGSLIPNGGFKIRESEIRGIKSCGMLCSEEELLIGSNSNGIIELPEHAVVGEQFLKYYGLDDPLIHINVTPNRGDALGVYGIARDLAARGIGKLKDIKIPEIKNQFHSDFSLAIEDNEACSVFTLREIKNIKNTQSPNWLKQLLETIGVGSISPVVDVTNYICYSFGRPMHAYDADKLAGKLEVKAISESVKFKALNDKEYNLESGDLVVTDGINIQCLAGIIGGSLSSCSHDTSNIILEAACFDPHHIIKSGRRLQIETDSRYRLERKVDQAFTLKAIDIATDMVLSICGGQASQIIYKGKVAEKKHISFPIDSLRKVTGISLSTSEIVNILGKLGINCEDNIHKDDKENEIIDLIIPSWRHDISIKEDIIEEIVRIYGYDKLVQIPLPALVKREGRLIPFEQRRISDIKRILAAQGYNEVVTWSFIDSKSAQLFAEKQEELTLLNPISNDLNYMRPSIIPGLLKVVSKNLNRSIKNISIFEVGPVFKGVKPEDELLMVSGVACGFDSVKNSLAKPRLIDVFDIKSSLEHILNYNGLSIDRCKVNQTNPSYYHPTRSGTLTLGKNILGTFGQIHPSILKHFDIDCDVVAFELTIKNIPIGKSKFGLRDQFIHSDFQSTIRDYAFVVDQDQAAGEILSYIRNIDKKLIRSVELFDIYSGDKLESGKKSVALSVEIQADDRTLTEVDLKLLSDAIISGVSQKFTAKLRE